MDKYRLNSVEIAPTETIPVLVACDKKRADGVAVHVANLEEAQTLGCVRVINLGALSKFASRDERERKAFQGEYGPLPVTERSRLFGLLLLLSAVKRGDSNTFDLAVNRLVSGPFLDWDRKALKKQPGIELGRRLAEGMQRVEFILWWKDNGRDSQILPGLRCPDLRTALYTLTVLQMEGGGGLGVCVVCGQPFVRQRRTRKTCSGKCRYNLFSSRKRGKATRRPKR